MDNIPADKLIENILQIPAEDRTTELKRLGKDFDITKALDSIVAMANTDGGFLILGVDDPQKTKLKGVDRVFGIEESPGLFPSNITLYNIGYVRAEGYRNDLLVKHLREFPEPPNLDQNESVRAMRVEMNRQNLYPPVFFTYPYLQDSVRTVLLNSVRATEWDKVYAYLSKKEKYITNESVRTIIDNPDTSKVSRLLAKWVSKGLLIRIETGSKKTVKYRLPAEKQA